MTEASRRWLVLADGSSHDAVDDAALDSGFGLVNVIPRGDTYPRQRIYARADGATFLHDVLDHAFGARYVVLAGAELDAVERDVRPRLEVIDAETLVASCSATDPAVATRALRLLGLAACGRVGPLERAAFERAASSTEPAVRDAALAAAAFAGAEIDAPEESP